MIVEGSLRGSVQPCCNLIQDLVAPGCYPEPERSTNLLNVRKCRDDEQPALLNIINLAALRYCGVIPADCWHEPYMTVGDLTAEMAAGVEFWGAELNTALVGVMGVQRVLDTDLIRHAYVLPVFQGIGIGGLLLRKLCAQKSRSVLIGTWAAASWAIAFYKRHGFFVVNPEDAKALLREYWTIPERQIETSVVLRRDGSDHHGVGADDFRYMNGANRRIQRAN